MTELKIKFSKHLSWPQTPIQVLTHSVKSLMLQKHQTDIFLK